MISDLQPVPDDWERALVVVAHPDDIEFGSSGAVAAWTRAGKTVSYLLLSHGEAGIDSMPPKEAAEVREREQRASAEIVGVHDVEFLGYPDGMIEYRAQLRRDIVVAISRYKPELLVAYNYHDATFSGRWNTPDHRNAGRATLDAVGDAANRWLVAGGNGHDGAEPWKGVRHVLVASSPSATHAVDVTESFDAAVASVQAHAQYLASLGITESMARYGLQQLTSSVASRFGGRPAVPFEMVQV
jgi:LmbE family N-acetylglucosaminyl deacetylase